MPPDSPRAELRTVRLDLGYHRPDLKVLYVTAYAEAIERQGTLPADSVRQALANAET